MDCSLPGSPVHGIFQARILEWVAISFSRRSSWPRDWTWVSCIVGRHFTIWATREAHFPAKDTTTTIRKWRKVLSWKSTMDVPHPLSPGFPRKLAQLFRQVDHVWKERPGRARLIVAPWAPGLPSLPSDLHHQALWASTWPWTRPMDSSTMGILGVEIVSTEAQGSLFRGLCQFSHNRGMQVKLMCSQEVYSMHDIFYSLLSTINTCETSEPQKK